MPEKATIKRAQHDKAEGKSASTQAGEFVHQEIDNIRKGKHGARSAKQAIAIGLSEARRAGVDVPPPKNANAETRKKAARETAKGKKHEPVSKTRSQAREKALKKESTEAASPRALSRQASTAASRRSATDRSASARKAAATKGPRERSEAGKKAARTRARNK